MRGDPAGVGEQTGSSPHAWIGRPAAYPDRPSVLHVDTSSWIKRPRNQWKESMSTAREVLTEAYDAFNARDIERALATMHADVEWPNGMEGGYVHGHDGVRDYWSRQWRLIDPHVEPRRFTTSDTGHVVVDVHQVVRDRSGKILTDQMVQHIYLIEGGLIRHMEIRK